MTAAECLEVRHEVLCLSSIGKRFVLLVIRNNVNSRVCGAVLFLRVFVSSSFVVDCSGVVFVARGLSGVGVAL